MVTRIPCIQRLHQPSWATRAIQCLAGEEQAVVCTLVAPPRLGRFGDSERNSRLLHLSQFRSRTQAVQLDRHQSRLGMQLGQGSPDAA